MDNNEVTDDEERKLVEMLHNEIYKIQVLEAKIKNNLTIFEEPSNPIDQHLVELESMTVMLQRNKLEIADRDDNKEQRDENFSQDLAGELKALTNDLSKLTSRIQLNDQKLLRMSKNLDHLKEEMEKNLNKDNNIDLQSISNNVNKRFKAEKKDLKTLIDALFPDQIELQDLIAVIIDHYFKEGSDKYYTLENREGMSALVETLVSTTLFELNPRDRLQIKMAELL